MKNLLVAATLVLASVPTTAWANGVEHGSLTLDGSLNSFTDSRTETNLFGGPVDVSLGLTVTATFPQFNLPGYQLTDVFLAFTLGNQSGASISSIYDYDPARSNGQLLEVTGSLGAVVDRAIVAGKTFHFGGAPDLAGCVQSLAPLATIDCAAASSTEIGSLSFDLNADDLVPFIGLGTVDIEGFAGTGFTFSVTSAFSYPTQGRVDGTVAFSALTVHYGYICLRDPGDLDTCAQNEGGGGGGSGSVSEPASLALLASGALAVLVGRRKRPPT